MQYLLLPYPLRFAGAESKGGGIYGFILLLFIFCMLLIVHVIGEGYGLGRGLPLERTALITK